MVKANNIQLPSLKVDDNELMTLGGQWLAYAFNRKTKQNGFWTIRPNVKGNPEKKIMDDHAWYFAYCTYRS